MTEQLGTNQTPDNGLPTDTRKRKRNTIACFQCRARKRRCTADYVETCENCLREGLECRKPDKDGRKTRWRKGQTTTGMGLDDQRSLSDDTRTEGTRQAEPDDLYSGCLYGRQSSANSDPHDVPHTISAEYGLPMGTGSSSLNEASTSQNHPGHSNEAPSRSSNTQSFTIRQELDHDRIWNNLLNTLSNFDSSAVDLSRPLRASPSHQTIGQIPDVKKVVWCRFHGPSAIAPGLKRITLKVRLDDSVEPSTSPLHFLASSEETFILPHETEPVIDEDGMPRQDLMVHLIDLERDLKEKSGSTLLFNCIASTASRFSKHPEIALANLEPHAYGRIFHKTAKNMLGNVLAVPTRETVLALTLLAGISHGIDSESEEWMAAGMAVRMAIDVGLHLTPPQELDMSEEERRLDRLAFWSVYFLDVALSFGVGRETAFRLPTITQTVPTESDFLTPTVDIDFGSSTAIPGRKAFPYAAKLAFAYGPLVSVVNGPRDDQGRWEAQAQQITQQAVEVYNSLPLDMQWSAYNLQSFSQAGQGSIFVQMHLWMHTILASGYLIGTDVLRPDRKSYVQGNMTPSNTTASRLWQHSARTIGDILIMSDIVNPFVYHALPFSNQPFVVAGCCYIKDADAQLQKSMWKDYTDIPEFGTSYGGGEDHQLPTLIGSSSHLRPESTGHADKAEMFRTLLQSVTFNNIIALRQGLVRQTRYWAGVAWVAEVLAQRMSGISMDNIDLKAVTEGLESTVAVADARMFARPQEESALERDLAVLQHVQHSDSSTTWDEMQRSMNADWLADTTFLQSQGYPVVVEDFTSDWARDQS